MADMHAALLDPEHAAPPLAPPSRWGAKVLGAVAGATMIYGVHCGLLPFDTPLATVSLSANSADVVALVDWHEMSGVYAPGFAPSATGVGTDSVARPLEEAKTACLATAGCRAVTCSSGNVASCTLRKGAETMPSPSGEVTFMPKPSAMAATLELNSTEIDASNRNFISTFLLFLGRLAIVAYFVKWGVIDNFKTRDSTTVQDQAHSRKSGIAVIDQKLQKVPAPAKTKLMVVIPLFGAVLLLIDKTLPGALLLVLFLAPSTFWQFHARHGVLQPAKDNGQDDPSVTTWKNLSLVGALCIFVGFRIPVAGAPLVLVGRLLWTVTFWGLGTSEYGGLPNLEEQLTHVSLLNRKILGSKIADILVFIVRMAAVEAAALGVIAAVAPIFGVSRFFVVAANVCGFFYYGVYFWQAFAQYKKLKDQEVSDTVKNENLHRLLKNIALLGAALCLIAYEI